MRSAVRAILENREFLEKKFPESRRKAYYLMAIHEQLPRQIHPKLKAMGWTKARELAKVARRKDRGSIVHPGCTRPARCPERNSSARWRST
jgi:hypothetical protein